MLFHLSQHHLPEYTIVRNNSKKRARTQAGTLPLSHERSIHLTNVICEFIIRDLEPISFVESSKTLKKLLKEIEPSYVIPTRNYFRDNVMKKKCVEVGTELRRDTRSGMDCNFIGDHNADNIRERIHDTLIRWSVLACVVCVVTDNTNVMVKVGRDLKLGWVGCFSHLLQTVVKTGSDVPDIKVQLTNVEKTASHIRRSYKAKDDLQHAQNQLGLTPRDLVQDVETRWNSGFYMIQRFVEEEQPLLLCFINPDFLRRFKDTRIVTGIDFCTLKLLLKILEPLEEMTRDISSATTSTMSLILVFLTVVLNSLEPDLTRIDDMRIAMNSQLNKWFKESFLNKFYLLSTILDARFKHFTFVQPSSFQANGVAAKTLVDWNSNGALVLAEKFLHNEYLIMSTPAPGTTRASSPLPSPPPTSLLSRIVTKQHSVISNEYTSYLSEPEIRDNECALVWWRKNQSRCPTIAKIARKFLCIPATSTPAERVFSLSGFITNERRSRLSPDCANDIIFLNRNSHFRE
ncbi:unnamed protein product [Didymodactylos carnosus]|uniref:HAT C-terminal dimerisation domain-containing protein n=1 Tax=Didymodactylos carnosus TaxID=1234261 RepID=A0A8S2IA50_9BILA|nr:unnamed protein product [Didymodactylos carnosus]CAF3731352.1 unnamed protein product [Didymodactylos carnosus]